MSKPNFRLKAIIIESFGTIAAAARQCDIREDRLSRIIHRRVTPSQKERRTLAWKLQKPIKELFPESQ